MNRFLLILLLISAFFITSCEKNNIKTEDQERKTAVLFSSLAEVWIKAGGDVDITVGEAVERGFAKEGTPLVDSGAGKSINIELLLSYKPSLVIYSSDIPAQRDAAEILKRNGIDVLACRIESFADYLDTLRIMTDITGNTAIYENEKSSLGTHIESIITKNKIKESEGKKILFLRAGSTAASTKTKSSQEHFAAEMLKELGCINIADTAPSSELGIEAILSASPEYIFISLMGNEEAARANVESLLCDKAWASLDAVKKNNVYILPKELFHFKPCTRWGEAYEYLANILTEGIDK